MSAIDRVKGFVCKVNEEQWRELVKVADEVGCPIGTASRSVKQPTENWACYNSLVKCLGVYTEKFTDCKPTTYPDFLAKLKGDEKWEPKNGEEVEVCDFRMIQWVKAEYISFSRGVHVVWCESEIDKDDDDVLYFENVRPLRPTITRKEAEEKLKALGVDVRITD